MNFGEASKSLKVRHEFQLEDKIFCQYGLNYSFKTKETLPWMGVRVGLGESWTLEANFDYIAVKTPRYNVVNFKRLKIPVDARLGVKTFEGGKHIEIGLHNAAIAASIAVLMLVLRKPIPIAKKEMGGFTLSLPIHKDNTTIPHILAPKIELDGVLSRQGRGLNLHLNELNGILRLSEE